MSTILNIDANSPPPGTQSVVVRLNSGFSVGASVNSVGDFSHTYPAGSLIWRKYYRSRTGSDDDTTVTAEIAVNASGSNAICNGLNVTVNIGAGDSPTSGSGVIMGTNDDDNIVAMGGDDTICGLDGNDTIIPSNGNDWVDAGPGNDTVEGGNGSDEIYGENDGDFIRGNSGNDTLDGGFGVDQILGGAGDDIIATGSGGNRGTGNAGNRRSG